MAWKTFQGKFFHNRRLAVLHIITGLNTGGAERSLYNILAGGVGRAFRSKVVSLTDEGTFGARIRAIGIPVSTLEIHRGASSASAFVRLRRVTRNFRPGLIQGWMYHGNVAAWAARSFSPIKPGLVWNIRHSLYGLDNEKWMTRQVIRANRLLSSTPDAILYNSVLSRQQHEAFGFSRKRGHIIPNGFDLARGVASLEKSNAIRHELDIPENAFVVGHVARLHPMKNHAGFLRAAVEVGREIDTVHFLLCGRDVVSENERLVSIVPSEMRVRFHFLGERNDIPNLMSAMDVFCSSSSWGEAFPNVLGEAMAMGVPCVATDVGDSREIVGSTGLVVPADDERSLANALQRLLVMFSEERRALGRGARFRIMSSYALDEVVSQYTRLYEALASHRIV